MFFTLYELNRGQLPFTMYGVAFYIVENVAFSIRSGWLLQLNFGEMLPFTLLVLPFTLLVLPFTAYSYLLHFWCCLLHCWCCLLHCFRGNCYLSGVF